MWDFFVSGIWQDEVGFILQLCIIIKIYLSENNGTCLLKICVYLIYTLIEFNLFHVTEFFKADKKQIRGEPNARCDY